uniref:Uncharacterized protein n=1 Tax=Candidatus Kentrum sp. FW TaxID=2126338 RepID=A0A450TMB8_9GAMM|nr:MAG: hypothetical protein BECKFW1821B_GA0114236_11557 [Candidatus Kentron sp. FW]
MWPEDAALLFAVLVVAMVEDSVITVITNYPLKKKYENLKFPGQETLPNRA